MDIENFAKIDEVKIDFVHTFEPFNKSCDIREGIRFASIPDLVALKLNALAGRGAKKDFWDLHELWNHFSFNEMIAYYHDHYPQNSYMMIAKSITYFKEAETDDDPFSFREISWEKIKKDIIKKFNLYLKSLE